MSGTGVRGRLGTEWGEVVSRAVVPAGHGRAFEARAGDHIIVTEWPEDHGSQAERRRLAAGAGARGGRAWRTGV
jgi:hypothetical protein